MKTWLNLSYKQLNNLIPYTWFEENSKNYKMQVIILKEKIKGQLEQSSLKYAAKSK